MIHFRSVPIYLKTKINLEMTVLKNKRKLSMSILLFSIFLLSTLALIMINWFRLAPYFTRIMFIKVWIIEFIVLIAYILVFYDAKKPAGINKRKKVLV